MDTTLRYVQQFGRSKRDNLKPSLLSKYHVGQQIQVYPFRIMDFGCFAATEDGLSGLLHNSEMTSLLQSTLPEMIEKQVSINVRINKFDRRTGEIAFSMENKETVAPPALAPVSVVASSTAESTEPVAAAVTTPETTDSTEDLVPFQFTTSQPVFTDDSDSFSVRLEQEASDIQKFLEAVVKQPLSPAAQAMLRSLLKQGSIFRFTYAMQTVVDEFEPDPGIQLLSAIDNVLQSQKAK
jgi:predicted RNA-binding protein with RPS1 domain